jgi:hypothetical protein
MLEVGSVVMLLSVGPFADLVQTTTVRLAPTGLVTLAHATPPSETGGYAARRSAARSRALRARGLAATSAADGVMDGRVTIRRRGLRPQTQIGTSGGHTQPRRSLAMKRLTMRSSSEW